MPKSDNGWSWWAGTDEWKTVGPCATREEAIAEAVSSELGFEWIEEGKRFRVAFEIVEARQDPLRLADWISEDLLERAEDAVYDSDRTSSENDDGPFFECSVTQEADLRERIARACDEWQEAHGLVFTCQTFSAARNTEDIAIEKDVDDDR